MVSSADGSDAVSTDLTGRVVGRYQIRKRSAQVEWESCIARWTPASGARWP